MDERQKKLIFYLNVALDWERLGPIWHAARIRNDINIQLVGSGKFFLRADPRIIEECGVLPQKDLIFKFLYSWRPDAFITATESSTFPHRRAYWLTRFANLIRIPTITMQHGYECVGINYADDKYGEETKIASRYILIWNKIDDLPQAFRKKIEKRCIVTGFLGPRPSAEAAATLKSFLAELNKEHNDRFQKWVMVTENLHWYRYNKVYRQEFVRGLFKAALANPETAFLVRPHPAKNYFEKHVNKDIPDNILLSYTFPEKISHISLATWMSVCDGLITSPSTTAIDAAALGKPVLVVRDSSPVSWSFDPLISIGGQEDWQNKVESMINNSQMFTDVSGNFIKSRLAGITEPGHVLDEILRIIKKRQH